MINNKNMRKFFVLSLILLFGSTCVHAAYFNDDIPANAGAYGSHSSGSTYNYNSGAIIGNTYYAPSGVSYQRQGNQIYGSDGSSYTQFDGMMQNNATGQSYQINNNLIQPLN